MNEHMIRTIDRNFGIINQNFEVAAKMISKTNRVCGLTGILAGVGLFLMVCDIRGLRNELEECRLELKSLKEETKSVE